MLVTATFAYLASKIGALSWGELIVIVAVANLGLQMMAGMNILKWSDDSLHPSGSDMPRQRDRVCLKAAQ